MNTQKKQYILSILIVLLIAASVVIILFFNIKNRSMIINPNPNVPTPTNLPKEQDLNIKAPIEL